MRALLGAIVALLVAASGAVAAPVALRDDRAATAIALAGPEVLVAREPEDGSVAVDAVRLDTGAVRRLLSVPLPGPGWRSEAILAASPERVGLIVELRESRGDGREWRLYSGPPSGPLSLVLQAPEREEGTWIPFLVDADADRLLVTEGRDRETLVRTRVFQPGLGLVPLGWAADGFAPVHIAGEHAAVLVAGDDRPARLARVAVADRRTGAEQASLPVRWSRLPIPGPDSVDVAADGRLIAASGTGTTMTRAGATAPLRIPHSRSLSSPRFAGPLIAAVERARHSERPVLVTPDDGASVPLGPSAGFILDLAADDRGVAWLANGCVRYAAVGAIPRAAAAPPAACPSTEIRLAESDSRLRDRTVRVPVTCSAAPGPACRGTIVLKRRGVVGQGAFAVPVDRQRNVDVRLNRRGLRYVRGLRFARLVVAARIPDGRVSTTPGTAVLFVDGR